jgi:hypothetical protein
MSKEVPDSWTRIPSNSVIVQCLQKEGILPSEYNERTLAQQPILSRLLIIARTRLKNTLNERRGSTKQSASVSRQEILEAAEYAGINKDSYGGSGV